LTVTRRRDLAPGAHARIVAVAALVAVIAVLAVVAIGGGGDRRHTLVAVIPEATQMITGQQIRAAGQPVGRIGSIEPARGGRAARVEFEFDEAAWPLPRGSKLMLRWGGTVSYSNRFVALTRARSGPALRDGETLRPGDFVVPVEFDSVLGTFTRRMRRDTRALLNTAGSSFDAARSPLRASLRTAPPAVEQASHVVSDLTHNQSVLETLLRSTDRVTGSIDRADPGVGPLLSGAGTTFRAIASESRNLETTLDRLTPALRQTRATLGHADGTLTAARTLAARLAPGVVELRRLARPLSDVLGTVVEIGPDARATLASVRRATPSLDPLLSKATTLMPAVGSTGRQAVGQLKCIRPYTPDIVSIFSNWGDFFSYVDDKDKMARVIVDNIPAAPNLSPYDSATATKLFPGLEYAFPRPPGLAAAQPWFLPECGVGPEALDPRQDPEGKR